MKRDLRKWKEKELPDRGISVSRYGGGLRQIRRERDRLRAAESMSQSIVSGIDVWREKNGMEQEKGKRPPLCWSSCWEKWPQRKWESTAIHEWLKSPFYFGLSSAAGTDLRLFGDSYFLRIHGRIYLVMDVSCLISEIRKTSLQWIPNLSGRLIIVVWLISRQLDREDGRVRCNNSREAECLRLLLLTQDIPSQKKWMGFIF